MLSVHISLGACLFSHAACTSRTHACGTLWHALWPSTYALCRACGQHPCGDRGRSRTCGVRGTIIVTEHIISPSKCGYGASTEDTVRHSTAVCLFICCQCLGSSLFPHACS